MSQSRGKLSYEKLRNEMMDSWTQLASLRNPHQEFAPEAIVKKEPGSIFSKPRVPTEADIIKQPNKLQHF
jgi:hypothetical protein